MDLLTRYPELLCIKEEIEKARALLIDTLKNGGKVMVCGNGGSCADCEHIVGELMKGFMKKRPVRDARIPEDLRCRLQMAMPAISLPSQTAVLSAFANDVDAAMGYAQLVYGYGKEGDLLIAISTSGNAENVVNAATVAKCIGVKTLALTGEKQSRLSELCDVTLRAPQTETYKVQELHLPLYHDLCAQAELALFDTEA